VRGARAGALLGSLLVGLSLAKGIVLATGAALVGVNHLQAHLLAPALERPIAFPALGLLVSGGHTQTYRMDSPTAFATLGRTLDDAAGEAFDKAAKTAEPAVSRRAVHRPARPDGRGGPRALSPALRGQRQPGFQLLRALKTAMVNHVAAPRTCAPRP
jgi:N6-L-threonylcarbamoyladenine synthase